MSSATRIAVESIWEYIAFASVIFGRAAVVSFGVVLLSILFQGTTARPLLRALNLANCASPGEPPSVIRAA